MLTWKSTIAAAFILLANAPPYFDPVSPAIRSLRHAGYKVEGEDPCNGSGLCCALLPACNDDDVFYVTLPDRKWLSSELRLLKRFQNLMQVRATGDVQATEFDRLSEAVGDPNLLLMHVHDR